MSVVERNNYFSIVGAVAGCSDIRIGQSKVEGKPGAKFAWFRLAAGDVTGSQVFPSFVVFGEVAEQAAQLPKGQLVKVYFRIQTRRRVVNDKTEYSQDLVLERVESVEAAN